MCVSAWRSVSIPCRGESEDRSEMKGVLFDWDGTLVDSETLLLRIWQKTAESLGRKVDEQEFHGLVGRVARDIALTLFPDDPPEFTDLILRRRLEFYHEIYDQVQPFPDAIECLDGLFRRGYQMAIMTSNSATRVRDRLQKFGWTKYFQGVIGDGMIKQAKPSPEIVLAAARSLGLPPQECYIVGDAQWDIVAGNRAGSETILVCRDEARREELLAYHPRSCVNDLRDIAKLLK